MFASVGRRLAILNAAVVLCILAVVSLGMLLFLQRSLDEEVDQALQDRAAAAQLAWADLFRDELASRVPIEIAGALSDDDLDSEGSEDDDGGSDEGEEREDEDHDAAEELLESGDTIAYALSRQGAVLADARGIPVPGLPELDALQPALAGNATTRELSIEGQPVRVYTEPVYIDGAIAGAVQVAQGQGEYEAALRVVRLATLGGLLLGAAVAIPAGLFLASRSMRPIRMAFDQQKAFVADASHELRTPLTVLRAQTEYLQRSPDLTETERAAGYQAIVDEVDAMSLLVNDLLLLARADSASMTLERAPNDLAAIARQAATSFAETARDAGVALSVDAGQPVVAQVDAGRMTQVIRILLDNAITHTPAGGSVAVSVNQRLGRAHLAVTDTGAGIESEDLERIFDRFYRGGRARTANSGGLGLGLAIARTLVEAHGGQISAASQPGAGSTFTIVLPL